MSLLFLKKNVLISDVRCTIVHACNNHFQALLPSRLKLHLDKESAHVSIMYALAVLSVCFEGWCLACDLHTVSSGVVCVCIWCNASLAVSLIGCDILVQCDLKRCILEMGGGQYLKQDLTWRTSWHLRLQMNSCACKKWAPAGRDACPFFTSVLVEGGGVIKCTTFELFTF